MIDLLAQILQISHLYSFNVFQLNYNENENANPKKNLRSTIKNFIREKEACFKQICKSANEKSRREKREATLPHRIQHVRHRASSITTDSKMASRSTGQSSDRIIESPKKKRGGGKKSSALYDISGKKMMVSKRRSSRLEKKSIGRVRGSAAKMAAPHQAIPRRGWWHTHRWPRFCRFCRSFFFFFFPPSLSPPQLSSTDSLSHGKRSLYSLVVGRLG